MARVPRVTAEYLRSLDACEEQVVVVEREWPRGAPVTVPTLRKALRLGLGVEWLARRVLSYEALTEYERVRARALAEYRRVEASAWAEYERVTARALAEYRRVKASAWAEYRRVTAQAWAEYRRVTASAWAPLLRAALEDSGA